jgi:hypothetical protein
LLDALKKRAVKLHLMIVLRVPIEWVEALFTQLSQAFGTIALHRGATPVNPDAVELITGNKFPEVSKFSLHETFLGKAQRRGDASSSLLGATKGLIELGKGAGPVAVQD